MQERILLEPQVSKPKNVQFLVGVQEANLDEDKTVLETVCPFIFSEYLLKLSKI
jgi:hypothetical protein